MSQIKKPFLQVILFTSIQLCTVAAMLYSEDLMLMLQLKSMLGEKKEMGLGIVSSTGLVVLSISSLIGGIVSDRYKIQYQIFLLGAFIFVCTLLARTFLAYPWWMVFPNATLDIIGRAAMGMMNASFNALLPTMFAKSQLGAVGGFAGFFMLTGTFIGITFVGLLYEFLPQIIWTAIFLFLMACGSINLLFINFFDKMYVAYKERKQNRPSLEDSDGIISDEEIQVNEEIYDSIIGNAGDNPQEFEIGIPPGESQFLVYFKNPSYTFALLKKAFIPYTGFTYMTFANFCASIATMISMSYTLYFIEEVFPTGASNYNILIPGLNDFINSSVRLRAFYAGILMGASLISSFLFGLFSDLVKMKIWFGVVTCLILAVAKLGVIITLEVNAMLVLGFVQGLSMGLLKGVEIAVINILLPNPKHAGRDLAFHSFVQTIAMTVGSFLGGFLVSVSNLTTKSSLGGYYAIFIVSAVAYVCAAAVMVGVGVHQLRLEKKPKIVSANITEESNLYDNLYENSEL